MTALAAAGTRLTSTGTSKAPPVCGVIPFLLTTCEDAEYLRPHKFAASPRWSLDMRYTIAALVFIVWLLGLAGIYNIGWYVHVLLVVSLGLIYLELISGRRTVG